MAEIFFLNNHIWLCAAVVSHSQPQSKWLQPFFYKTLKRFQKKPVFGHFWKSQWVKLAKYYLKSTTRQYWIRISFYFHWKTLFLTYFLVYWKFLLYQSGTIVCSFIVVLKHKCTHHHPPQLISNHLNPSLPMLPISTHPSLSYPSQHIPNRLKPLVSFC